MIPIFYRGHIFSFCKQPDEVRLVIEAAIVAYFGGAELCVCKQVACLGHSKVVHISDERDACLFFEEMAEGGI